MNTELRNEALTSGASRDAKVFTPQAELLVSDLETLRVLADPLRLHILEVFEAHPGHALTVKTVAGALGEPVTKLYYHVNLLEEHGLLVVVERRLVSGIVEKHYRVAADSIRVERSLLSGSPGGLTDEARTLLDTVYGSSRRSLELSLRAGTAHLGLDESSPQGVLLSRSTEPLAPGAAAEARRILVDAIDRIHALAEAGQPGTDGHSGGGSAPGQEQPARPYALLIAFHPATDETGTAPTAADDPSRTPRADRS